MSRTPLLQRIISALLLVISLGGFVTFLKVHIRLATVMICVGLRAYQVTVCTVPTFQTVPLPGEITGGSNTSRASSLALIGAAVEKDKRVQSVKMIVVRKNFMIVREVVRLLLVVSLRK